MENQPRRGRVEGKGLPALQRVGGTGTLMGRCWARGVPGEQCGGLPEVEPAHGLGAGPAVHQRSPHASPSSLAGGRAFGSRLGPCGSPGTWLLERGGTWDRRRSWHRAAADGESGQITGGRELGWTVRHGERGRLWAPAVTLSKSAKTHARAHSTRSSRHVLTWVPRGGA